MTATPHRRRPPDVPRHEDSDDVPPEPADARLRLRGPADVVAAVPYLLGHSPSRSLVALAVRAGGDLGVVCRADLPEPGDDQGACVVATAARIGEALHADGAESALLALYDGVDPGAAPDALARETAAATAAALAGAGVDVADALHVGPHRWRSLLCRHDGCCPPAGFDVAEAKARPVAVGFVVSGRHPVADRDSLEPVPTPAPPPLRRAAAQSAARWRRRVRAAAGGPGGGELQVTDRFRVLDEWLRLLDEHRRSAHLPGPAVIGRLAAAWTDDLRVRDACMVALLPAAALVPDALLAGSRGDIDAVLADRSCAGVARGPAPLLRHMASHLAGPPQAAVLALHAWLAWASGEGAAAGDLASRAVRAQPGHRLATLVLDLLDRAVPPGWAAPGADPARTALTTGAGT